mmetsp:Transcript_65021/g.128567  ORF Transcript_65021/g.128567 Transcript_65021/m.128567 type:complete len:276 (-) Transcript_65021:200-1027(-)
MPASSFAFLRWSADTTDDCALAVSGLMTELTACLALRPVRSGCSAARKERRQGMETPVRSNGGSALILALGSANESFWPSGFTPTRPLSLAAVRTMPSLPLSSGFEVKPSIRTIVEPASSGCSAGVSAGASEAMPCHCVLITSRQRGAACTAAIHSSRLATQQVEPCSQPMAVPAATRARSRCEPVIIWKPNSVAVTRELMSTGKSPRCVAIVLAAPKTPPGGAVGNSTLRVCTSNGLAFWGCLAFSRCSRYICRATEASSSIASAMMAITTRVA